MIPRTMLRSLGYGFLGLCAVQTIAMFGHALCTFAVGVFVYRLRSSALDFAMVQLATTLPMVLALPWAGSAADRHDRRAIVLLGGLAAAAAAATLLAFDLAHVLTAWHLYAFALAAALSAAFQRPAFWALATDLLPRAQISRGSGVINANHEIVTLLAPLASGALLEHHGLRGVITVDLLLFTLAFALLLQLFPVLAHAARSHRLPSAKLVTVAADFAEMAAYFKSQPLLRALLGYVVLQGALVTLVSTLIAPLVLSRFGSAQLGLVLTMGGVGGVVGSVWLALTGQRRHLMVSMLLCDLVLSICMVLVGLSTSLKAYLVCAAIAFAAVAAAMGFAAAIWTSKIPNEKRGRLFAFVGALSISAGGALTAGGAWLSDAMQGRVAWNTGPSIVFMLAGALCAMVSLYGLSQVRFRRLDTLLPDA